MFRRTLHSPGNADLSRDGLTEGKVASGGLIMGDLSQRLPSAASDQAHPHVIGKLIHCWLTAMIGSPRVPLKMEGSEDLLKSADTCSLLKRGTPAPAPAFCNQSVCAIMGGGLGLEHRMGDPPVGPPHVNERGVQNDSLR